MLVQEVFNASNAALALVDRLIDLDIDVVFVAPGEAVAPIADALRERKAVRYVLVRGEQAAIHAAEGYARTTGKVGVVLVSSGSCMSNATTGLLDAMCDSVPVLCISGQVATKAIGKDSSQECDALGISRPVTKWNVQARKDDSLAALVQKAVQIARDGRPGPVHVDVPVDIQRAKVPAYGALIPFSLRAPKAPPRVTVRRAAEMIAQSNRPILYGGGGLVNSGVSACMAFARLAVETGAPVTLTLMGLGAFPASNSQWLGMLGMYGTRQANLAMQHADLVVCVGARFDSLAAGTKERLLPTARVIHIDIDPTSINKLVKADLPLVGDCATVLQLLCGALGEFDLKACRLARWWEVINGWRSDCSLGFSDDPGPISPQVLLRRLQVAIQGRDAVVSADVGPQQMWAASLLRFELPNRWLTSGGAGTRGYGLPAAIGAQIARPETLVVCISDVESILLHLQELATAVQHRVPVKVLLINSGFQRGARAWPGQSSASRLEDGCGVASPDVVAVAKAFGWQAERLDRRADLDESLRRCLTSESPFLLDVHLQVDENSLPMSSADWDAKIVCMERTSAASSAVLPYGT